MILCICDKVCCCFGEAVSESGTRGDSEHWRCVFSTRFESSEFPHSLFRCSSMMRNAQRTTFCFSTSSIKIIELSQIL
jgi:hypothetical protein